MLPQSTVAMRVDTNPHAHTFAIWSYSFDSYALYQNHTKYMTLV